MSYDEAISKAVENVARAERAAKRGDFHSHFRWAVAYSVMVRFRNLRKTGGKVGLTAPDGEFLRILELCRQYASDPRDEAALCRFEAGRVWISVAADD